MIKYTKIVREDGYEFIERINEDESVSHIPIEPANSDYQGYLKSLDEASTL
jgi:hypothetical protein